VSRGNLETYRYSPHSLPFLPYSNVAVQAIEIRRDITILLGDGSSSQQPVVNMTTSSAATALLFLVVMLSQCPRMNGLAMTKIPTRTMTFPSSSSPFLVVITHAWSCDSDEAAALALDCLARVVVTAAADHDAGADRAADREDGSPFATTIDLISIRVRKPDRPSPDHTARVLRFIQSVLQLCCQTTTCQPPRPPPPRVVVSSDWLEQGIQANAHGIHFKEAHRHWIPNMVHIRRNNKTTSADDDDDGSGDKFIIGTSAHTVDSALDAVETYGVDYLICGTCYPTESHPEKTEADVEGPAFPAQVKEALLLRRHVHDRHNIPVIAIGGLDVETIPAQVNSGAFIPHCCADGVAVIRAVLDADDPSEAVQSIRQALRRGTARSSG
jgi:thiamine monophosphate synthase